MLLRAFATWLLLLVVAIIAAGVRTRWLEPRLGEHGAHVAGTLLVVAFFSALIGLLTPWIVPGLEPAKLWTLGIAWLVMTVAFEFLFGHYVVGHPWSRLLADYDFTAGRLWPLVLLVLLLLPALTGRWSTPR